MFNYFAYKNLWQIHTVSFFNTVNSFFFNACCVAVHKPCDVICEENLRLWVKPSMHRVFKFIIIGRRQKLIHDLCSQLKQFHIPYSHSLISASTSAGRSSGRDVESRPDHFSSSSFVLPLLKVSTHSYTFLCSIVYNLSLTFCYTFQIF